MREKQPIGVTKETVLHKPTSTHLRQAKTHVFHYLLESVTNNLTMKLPMVPRFIIFVNQTKNINHVKNCDLRKQ